MRKISKTITVISGLLNTSRVLKNISLAGVLPFYFGISSRRKRKSVKMEQENKEESGYDQQGSHYETINEMWETELKGTQNANVVNAVGSKENWYNKASEYWEAVEPTYDGVLGGFGHLSSPDIKSSEIFVDYLINNKIIDTSRAIDCGAGIGRITKELLIRKFKKVDLVEQNPKYIEKAKEILREKEQVGEFYVEGLQTFEPKLQYDCIWVQWVSNHLTDEDFILFMNRCDKALSEKGVIVVKENITKTGFVVDKEDYSVTRSDEMYRELFKKAGLNVIHSEFQKDFPKEMFRVIQYALRKE